MSKKYAAATMNELTESVYFRPPAPTLRQPASPPSTDRPSTLQESTHAESEKRPSPVPESSSKSVRPASVPTSVRSPVRRTISRYAFEFFQDQIESLRRLSLEEKTAGEKGSMSQMVREALDGYIAKRHRVEE